MTKAIRTTSSGALAFGRVLSLFVLMLTCVIQVNAQKTVPVRGTVVSADDGEPLVGVSVQQEGSTVGAVTDIDGNFTLQTAIPAKLKFSYVGFQTATVKVSDTSPVRLSLQIDAHSLDEVMVVGYGIQKKKLITGATVQVKGDDIAKLNTVNALGALQSQTPGVDIISSSGMPGEGFKVTIRGLGTTGSSSPLYIIDGMTGGDINAINPGDIESIDVLKLGENITYSYIERSGISIGDMWGNDVRNLLHSSPFLPNLDEDGNYHYAIPWESREANPIGLMEYGSGHNRSKEHWLMANVYAQLEPIKGLRIKTNFGYQLSASTSRSFIPVYKLASNTFTTENLVSQGSSTGTSLLWENTVNYNTKLGKHSIDALLGQSIEKSGMGESINGSNYNSIFSDFKHAYLDNTPVVTGRTQLSGAPWGDSKLASFFGRVNYDYDGKYMASAVLRADGSSNFASGHRWGYFPSVSAGWIITEEPWMKKTSRWMDYLKLRASWGQNGNQDIPAFQYLSTISFSGSDYTFGPDKSVLMKGAYPDILANEDLTWETSEQLDLGIDARFLDNRLGLTFDYYVKTTKDWLVEAPILDSYGTGAPYINGGDVRNSGFELALSWNDEKGGLRYGVNWNMAYNKNKVTRIANSEGIIHGASNILSNGTTEIYRAQVGYPIGYFYGYSTAGVFQTEEEIAAYKGAKLDGTRPGDVIWVDRNNDGVIDERDEGMIGNPHPDVTMGLGLNAAYKGFDISATLHGAFGQQIMKSYRSFVDYARQNYTSDIFGRWHGPGTSNRLPRLTTGTSPNWQFVSDLYMENGDYVRMQDLTVGYDFKQLFKNMPLQQLRLYFTAENLFTITGYSGMDPEVGYGGYESWVTGVDIGSYPSARTYIVGVNIKF